MPAQSPNNPVAIGVSSCLLGENVRHDGGNKLNEYITTILATEFILVPCCPEVAIGLGTPRPPIQLTEQNNHLRALGRDDPSIDVTEQLQQLGKTFSEENKIICGYIFKSRSPSCGLNDTVIKTETGDKTGIGLFAASIQTHLPHLPVIDEIKLALPEERERFLDSVRAMARD